MARKFEKHRSEAADYEFDLTDELGSGVTVASVDAVQIKQKQSAHDWDDVSSEFGSPSGAVAGDNSELAQFTLGAAGANDEQVETYDYAVEATVILSDGQKITAEAELVVIGRRDTA